MLIAEHGDIKIKIPRKAWYSFFNSPYIGHRNGTAIDIYFPDDALFPTNEGTLINIHRVHPPERFFKGDDFVMVFKITDDVCLKILHVRPRIKSGERVYEGDAIGEMITSGFFMPWSSKHAHVELRRCEDSIRARGGLPLRPIIVNNVPIAHGNEFEIVESSENFCWAVPRKIHGRSMTPIAFKGHGIEGGLPHYEYGAIFSKDERIHLFSQEIRTKEFSDKVRIFKSDFQIFANKQKIRGIGIYCNQPKIKIIGGCEGIRDEVEITAKSFSQKG